jgi:membrane associated rhomboid family serine protease
MLEDRPYMRRSPLEGRFSATVLLVIVNVAVFGVQSLLERFPSRLAIQYFTYLPLSLQGLKHGWVWQLLTYQFMHSGLLHLVCNCWVIYLFGREVEMALGRRPFVALYLASGVVGGLVQALAAMISMERYGGPVVGASAAAFGVAAAFALLYPNRTLLVFFVIPMRAKFVLLACAVLAVAGVFRPPNQGSVHIADAAHLGGMACGILFIRYAMHWHWPRFRTAKGQPRRLVRVPSREPAIWSNSTVIEAEPPSEDFLSREVDPILEKITAHGIQSLTRREREILEAARARMAKR